MAEEARFEESQSGLAPASGGWFLMVGAIAEDEGLRYPVSELAGKHGASAEAETTSGQEAYASYEGPGPGRPDGWDGLPWPG